jgi:branched-chain amino acid aminotransferase
MKLSQPLSLYRAECEKSLKAFQALPGMKTTEAYCRIIVSRGTGKIGFGTENLLTPSQYFIIVQPLNPPTEAFFEKGYEFQVVKRLRNDPRALDPAMKSGNYLNSLLAYLEVTEHGAIDDAILCNLDGEVTEGTTFNVFYIKRGILVTPPLDVGILEGVTRRLIIQMALRAGIEVREVRFPRDRLLEADEMFASSTLKEVFPVLSIDGHRIGTGKPGPLTRKLHGLFRKEFLPRTSL